MASNPSGKSARRRLERVAGHLNLIPSGGVDAKDCAGGRFSRVSGDEILSYELFKVPPRWVFLRIETKQGVVGWGEPNLEGWSDSVIACVLELMEHIKHEDPTRISYIFQKIHRQKFYGHGGGQVVNSALAGIDQALWDILGKKLQVPVHTLLGGAVRHRLLVYRWCGGDNNTPQEAAAEAKALVQSSNYRLIKMNACPRMRFIDTEGAVEAARQRMAAVRAAVGPDIGIGLDFHGRVKAPMAKKLMAALAPYNPLFFEEAVVPEQNGVLKQLAAATTVPLATGERMYSLYQFRDLLETRSVAMIQPDVSHAGGITNLFSISRMAEAYDVALAPHSPLGPLALAACMQVDSCSANFAFQETSLGIHYNQEGGVLEGKGDALLYYIDNPEVFDVDSEGYMKLPTGHGLGIKINEERVRVAAKTGHSWKDRDWTLEDGTPTRW